MHRQNCLRYCYEENEGPSTMNSAPRHPLTLRDVSQASGVSEMTVSRVLRNRGDVSQNTRDKVLLVAKQLGYVPNKIAGALASQRDPGLATSLE